MENRVLIYINNSLGELDWIADFLLSNQGKKYKFSIFFNFTPKNSYDEILLNYNLLKPNISLANKGDSLEKTLIKINYYLDVLNNKFKKNYIFSLIKRWIGAIYSYKYNEKYDLIFRDYNLKDSIILFSILLKNKDSKVVVFPHATIIQDEMLDLPLRKVDLWLGNTKKSIRFSEHKIYKDFFYECGSPKISTNIKKGGLFSQDSKNIILYTRVSTIEYGFTFEEALDRYDELLRELNCLGYQVYVKHHPRESKKALEKWGRISEKYKNVLYFKELSLVKSKKFRACLTFFSSAPLYMLARKIPVYEISPYKQFNEYDIKLPFHYKDEKGNLTNEYLSNNMYKRIEKVQLLGEELKSNNVAKVSEIQFSNLKNIYKSDACEKIGKKLQSLCER